MEMISLSEYGRRRGVSAEAVSRAAKAGRISVIIDERGRKRVNPAVADVEWATNTRARADAGRPTTNAGQAVAQTQRVMAGGALPEAAGSASERGRSGEGERNVGADYWESRARRERAEAEQAELRLAKERGELIHRAAVERAIETAWRAVRDRVIAVPDRLPLDPEVRATLAQAIRDALTDAERVIAGGSAA